MSNKSQPLYSLTIGEYLELNQQMMSDMFHLYQGKFKESKIDLDRIFIEEAMEITGYKKATIYSKLSKNEIPCISRRKPLTFSRKRLIEWIENGKCSLNNSIDLKNFLK